MVLRIVLFITCIFFAPEAAGQRNNSVSRQFEAALQAYEQRDYEKATGLCKKLLEKNPSDMDVMLLLAEISKDRGLLADEIHWLRSASQNEMAPLLISYRLADALLKSGRYAEAYDAVNQYLAGKPSASLKGKAEEIRNKAAFGMEAVNNPVDFKPENLGKMVNTEWDEYWPSLTIDGQTLIFTRLVPRVQSSGYRQEDFYISKITNDGWGKAQPLVDLNTELNEGAQTVSADGKLLFFTLCNSMGGYGSCDIYFSRWHRDNWTPPMNAGSAINTQGWEGQPSISAYGDVLYFSSNRPGGFGLKDIWRSRLLGWSPEGIPLWENPVNLGDSVNTRGDEISPFIHFNGKDLYFSSDEWPGMGGYDIFHSGQKADGTWTHPTNLGYPVNTHGNEQGLVIERSGKVAFMASGRESGKGMDLYSFELDNSVRPEPVTYIKGLVVEAVTGDPVQAMVRLTALDSSQTYNSVIPAAEDGSFTIALPADRHYAFHVSEPGFLFYSEHFFVESLLFDAEPVSRKIELIPLKSGSQTHLYNVFFPTDGDDILPESIPELLQLYRFLSENPALNVELQGHTDNTGGEDYNIALSERRARSVMEFLVEKGIHRDRLTARGYGMSKPISDNITEEGRSKNRRTTVEIISVSLPDRP